jgi:alpha-beta hydrolase superfamily lysophospholipase
VGAAENRALRACAAFEGDVLIVESEHDNVVPHQAIANYIAAFERAHSLTYRIIAGADHGLSEELWQQAYTSLLVNWAKEMVLGMQEDGAALRSRMRRKPPLQEVAPLPD